MVVIGGMGTLYGPVLGAVVIVLAQYYLQRALRRHRRRGGRPPRAAGPVPPRPLAAVARPAVRGDRLFLPGRRRRAPAPPVNGPGLVNGPRLRARRDRCRPARSRRCAGMVPRAVRTSNRCQPIGGSLIGRGRPRQRRATDRNHRAAHRPAATPKRRPPPARQRHPPPARQHRRHARQRAASEGGPASRDRAGAIEEQPHAPAAHDPNAYASIRSIP